MEIYLVGGAVRDALLGQPIKERDWVVVGATPKEMLDNGFSQVGKDFPVFLHPDTKEEYALARKERKVAGGYHGFSFDTQTSVTLEEDLKRRDLTINAMAQTEGGDLIDPFGGQADLSNKVLRHVSDAFSEDPVRILRVARFAARLMPLGFQVAEETLALMQQMVQSGEVDHLVPERTWKEMVRALKEPQPVAFIQTLRACGALQKILPEIDALYGVPQTEKWHPEIDTGIHTEMALKQAVKITEDPEIRFAVLLHDVGKGQTPKDILPSHVGHEMRGVKLIKKLCARIGVPKTYRDLSLLMAQFHTHCHKIDELKSTTVITLLEHLDAFRRPERFQKFLLACTADARGRKGHENEAYPQALKLQKAFEIAKSVDVKMIVEKSPLKGEGLKNAIRQARVKALKTQQDILFPFCF